MELPPATRIWVETLRCSHVGRHLRYGDAQTLIHRFHPL
jgi:hypothetical protein